MREENLERNFSECFESWYNNKMVVEVIFIYLTWLYIWLKLFGKSVAFDSGKIIFYLPLSICYDYDLLEMMKDNSRKILEKRKIAEMSTAIYFDKNLKRIVWFL